jgi:hypothetical protein
MSQQQYEVNNGSDFFGRLFGYVDQAKEVYKAVEPFWNRQPTNSPPPGEAPPTRTTFQGEREGTTGGPITIVAPSELGKYMPIILIGGAVLLLVVILKD